MNYKFVVIRWTDESILIFPVKLKATDQEIDAVVAKKLIGHLDGHVGYEFFEGEEPKRIKSRIVVQKAMEYARTNCQLIWRIDEGHAEDCYCIGADSVEYILAKTGDKELHDFDHILRVACRDFGWRRFEQR